MVSENTFRVGVPLGGYILVFGLSAIACYLSALRARRIQDAAVRHSLLALVLLSGSWAASHVGYLAATSPQLQYGFYLLGLIIGISAVGPWLYFCSAYTGRSLHKHRRVQWAAVGLFLLIICAKVTNPIHGWYFTTELISTPFQQLLIHSEPLHWVVMGLAYAFSFIGFFMLFEMFGRISHDTTPLYVLVGLTGLPVLFDVIGATTPYFLDMTYSPVGVAAFAVGILFVYYEEFQTVRFAGQTDDPIIILDDDERIHDMNDAARDLFPTMGTNTDQPLEDVLPAVARMLGDPDPVIDVDQDGDTRYFSITANPVTADRTRLGKYITLSDVTERQQYRRELEQKNERLEAFASIASHDLRNPLNVAQGHLQMAIEECDSKHHDTVAEALDRMGALIDDLLTLAREGEQVSETESIELAELAQSCWQTVQTEAATIHIDTDRTLQADASRLRQVFENLFRNAIEHGRTDVTITIGDIDGGFYIGDDGPGIPDHDRQAIFDTGYSTAEDGTGFGLSIVQEVIAAHGWDITVTAGTDGGARFEITGVGDHEE